MTKLWEDSEIEVDDNGDEHVNNPLVRSDVPWQRNGHPLWIRKSHGIYIAAPWAREVANVGIFPERLFTDEYITDVWKHHSVGVEERAFAEMWDYNNNGHGTSKVISIVNSEPIASMVKTPDDWKLVQLVAQTIIQWLGTNCGSCFVDEARKLAQLDKERLRLIVDPKGVERDAEWARKSKPVHSEFDVMCREEQHRKEIAALEKKHAEERAQLKERHRKELLDEMEAQRKRTIALAERIGSTSRLIEV